jgi:hypothetical protein
MKDFNESPFLILLPGLREVCREVDMTSCISHTAVKLIKAIHRTAEIAPRAVVVRHVALRLCGWKHRWKKDEHGRHVPITGLAVFVVVWIASDRQSVIEEVRGSFARSESYPGDQYA